MALTKSDIPELILPGLRADFAMAYRAEIESSPIEQIATIVNTTLPSQSYAWLGAVPPMREFVDERRPQGLAAYSQTIEDKVFESTIAVERRAIEDDQLDLIRLRVRDLAFRVATHRHQMVVEALALGGGVNGYDGVPFFSDLHPVPGGTYANTSGDALSASSLSEAISKMMLVPDDSGIPLGIAPDTLVVGPALQWDASELLESPVVVYHANQNDAVGPTPYRNALQGRMRLIVSPFLRGDSEAHWFLLDTKRPVRAILMQQRSDVPVEFEALDSGSGSESAFMRDRYYYGVRGRYNVGYGLWQTAYAGLA